MAALLLNLPDLPIGRGTRSGEERRHSNLNNLQDIAMPSAFSAKDNKALMAICPLAKR